MARLDSFKTLPEDGIMLTRAKKPYLYLFCKTNLKLLKMAPGKGFEPLRAQGPLANLPSRLSPLLLDLEASAITTPPPRLQ